jgi:FHA domain-containing protein/uncharacterized protein DUF4388
MSAPKDAHVLSGHLGIQSVEDLLRLLSARRETGVLDVQTEGQKTILEITGGELTAARTTDDEGERALGYVLQARRGDFAFYRGPTGTRNVSRGLDEVMEAAREVAAELAAIRKDIPNDHVRFTVTRRMKTVDPATLSADARAVLQAVVGERSVEDIVVRSRLGRFRTLQHLRRLLTDRLVEETRDETSAPPQRVEAPLAADEPPRLESAKTALFEYHYLPAGVEPAQLDIEKPAQRSASLLGRFGLGTEVSEAPVDVPPPGQLAAFVNELGAEFRLRAAAEKELADRDKAVETFSVSLASRLERMYVSHPIGRRLPLRDERIDPEELTADEHPSSDVLPYLAGLIRELRDDAERAWGKNETEEIYDAVARRVLGRAWVTEPDEILRLAHPKVRGRITVRIGGTGSFDLAQHTYVLGRLTSCDIVLADATVSNRHARLTPHLDGFMIADLGSTNGTSVNNESLIGERLLRGGEILRLGDATLLYERVT